MPANQSAQIILRFPVKGLVQGFAYEDQPEGTTSDCLNVMPFDGAQDRARGGQRPGFHDEENLGVNAQVQALGQATYTTGSAVANAVYAACDDDIFVGATPSTMAAATSGTNALATSTAVANAANILNHIYFVAGQRYVKILKLADSTVYTMGTAPYAAVAGTPPEYATLCCNWRSRLVLSGIKSEPQNIYMSYAGNPLDWDYSDNTELAAVALNSSDTAGVVGEPVRAIVPFSNDILIISTDSNIFALEGDPAAGGVISTISRGNAILSQQAWTLSPEGDLYFFGVGGFYRLGRGGEQLENLSAGRVDNFFTKSYASTVRTICCWDTNQRGCWITRYGYATNTCMWWDQRADGFFEHQFPSAFGPCSAMFYDDFGTSTPALRVGGTNGHIYRFDELEEDDAGTAITSRCVIGPFRPGGTGEARLTALEIYTGDYGSMDVGPPNNGIRFIWTMTSDKQAQDVPSDQANRVIGGTIRTTGRYITRKMKLSGGTFRFEIGSTNDADAFWSFERAVATFTKTGRQR